MLKAAPSKAKKTALAKKAVKAQFSTEEYLSKRDYTGALTLLEFQLKCKDGDSQELLSWIGYCAFHLGNFNRAESAFRELLDTYKVSDDYHLYIACCYFYQQEYDDALDEAKKGPNCSLKTRLLFNINHQKGDEKMVLTQHQQLKDTCEDQLTLAAVHFQRGHYQEATDVYKQLLLENRDDLAYNVYVAMCYYKLDYYDVSLEILAAYLQAFPHSTVAINLKACNHFRLYNGKAAEAELKQLVGKGAISAPTDLVRHNMVVFSNGEQALQVLPGLVDTIPEARLNLVIYYLRRENIQEAYSLIKDIEPTNAQEFILKGVVYTMLAQHSNNPALLKTAQQCFQSVGTSTHECDTIPGRQAMASFYYLMQQFDDVNVYLNSIKAYLYNDDDFNFNYGISLAATRQYKLAEETLLQVKIDKYRSDMVYISWISKCYVMNGNPRSAWEMYLKMVNNQDSLRLLKMIANDCYKMGQFVYAAKAFDMLEQMDPDPSYWDAKRGACIGIFQQLIHQTMTTTAAGSGSGFGGSFSGGGVGQPRDTTTNATNDRQQGNSNIYSYNNNNSSGSMNNSTTTTVKPSDLQDALNMIRTASNPQVEYITRIIKKWCKDNNIKVN